MKVLSIQQPWAALICAGIKDVENRTWKAAKVPGAIKRIANECYHRICYCYRI